MTEAAHERERAKRERQAALEALGRSVTDILSQRDLPGWKEVASVLDSRPEVMRTEIEEIAVAAYRLGLL